MPRVAAYANSPSANLLRIATMLRIKVASAE